MEELLGKETSLGFSHQATGRTTSKPSTCPSGRSLGRSRGGAETDGHPAWEPPEALGGGGGGQTAKWGEVNLQLAGLCRPSRPPAASRLVPCWARQVIAGTTDASAQPRGRPGTCGHPNFTETYDRTLGVVFAQTDGRHVRPRTEKV